LILLIHHAQAEPTEQQRQSSTLPGESLLIIIGQALCSPTGNIFGWFMVGCENQRLVAATAQSATVAELIPAGNIGQCAPATAATVASVGMCNLEDADGIGTRMIRIPPSPPLISV
jgi:hypothetical protein